MTQIPRLSLIMHSVARATLPNVTSHDVELFQQYIDAQARVMLTFQGYDDDTREIFEVPECREWMQEAVRRFPQLLAHLMPDGYLLAQMCCNPPVFHNTGPRRGWALLELTLQWQEACNRAGIDPLAHYPDTDAASLAIMERAAQRAASGATEPDASVAETQRERVRAVQNAIELATGQRVPSAFNDPPDDGPSDAEMLATVQEAARACAQRLGAEIVQAEDSIAATYRGEVFAIYPFYSSDKEQVAWDGLTLTLMSIIKYRHLAT